MKVANKGIQLVTISRPTAYGEYAPYSFIKDEKECYGKLDGIRRRLTTGFTVLIEKA